MAMRRTRFASLSRIRIVLHTRGFILRLDLVIPAALLVYALARWLGR